MSELKCCKLCGAFSTCTNKGECCPECEYFDAVDAVCMAIKSPSKASKKPITIEENADDVDPETFLFEDDDEEEEEKLSDSTDDEDAFDY